MDRYQYLLLMAACLAITLPLEFVLGARVYRRPALLVAALVPDHHYVTLVDENVEDIDFDKICEADLVCLTGMSIQDGAWARSSRRSSRAAS